MPFHRLWIFLDADVDARLAHVADDVVKGGLEMSASLIGLGLLLVFGSTVFAVKAINQAKSKGNVRGAIDKVAFANLGVAAGATLVAIGLVVRFP